MNSEYFSIRVTETDDANTVEFLHCTNNNVACDDSPSAASEADDFWNI